MEYTKNVNISEVEWLVVQNFRKLIANKFGTMYLIKVHKGNITDSEQEIDIRVRLKDDADKLKELQK
jgi:hypothetical protein